MRGKRAQPSPAPFWSRITPRACGENIPRPLHNLRVQGSPPRMRGKRQRVNLRKHRLGITPAHAGKTTEGSWISTAKRDHPRACGENSKAGELTVKVKGSPPRMRGKQRRVVLQYEDRGITPAHAGKTGTRLKSLRRRWDHPRACGENRHRAGAASRTAGSPPRMRGKQQKEVYEALKEGITPAHAGKTIVSRLFFNSMRDHPRACGENPEQIHIQLHRKGSPPRMRGKRATCKDDRLIEGITPAHAGKTFSNLSLILASWDHPRACGENVIEFVWITG